MEDRAIDQDDWLNRLLLNVFGYLMILFPGGLLVYMVKKKICFPQVQSFAIVRLFVFGKEEKPVGNDVELQRMLADDDVGDESKASSPSNRYKDMLHLGYCFAGLQVSYLIWGVLQEKIMTTEYTGFTSQNESHKIKFRDSQFLVLVNRILALVFSVGALLVRRFQRKTPLASNLKGTTFAIAPLYEFVFCSLSNILSSWCQYEALKFVNFPTQVLSKACKILPVMLMSQVVGGKKYKMHEYVCALAISFGMSLFLLDNHQNNSHATKHIETNHSSNYNLFDGLLVLALYLTFDSFTSNWQGKLFEKYKISTFQMMAAVNSYSILLTFTSLTQQGDLLPALRSVLSSVQLSRDCVLLSTFSAAGQLFVFYTIANFGALVFVTIMTLRQALAIILSCIIYGHTLHSLAFFGIFVVFATLFLQIYWKYRNKGRK